MLTKTPKSTEVKLKSTVHIWPYSSSAPMRLVESPRINWTLPRTHSARRVDSQLGEPTLGQDYSVKPATTRRVTHGLGELAPTDFSFSHLRSDLQPKLIDLTSYYPKVMQRSELEAHAWCILLYTPFWLHWSSIASKLQGYSLMAAYFLDLWTSQGPDLQLTRKRVWMHPKPHQYRCKPNFTTKEIYSNTMEARVVPDLKLEMKMRLIHQLSSEILATPLIFFSKKWPPRSLFPL